MGFCPECGTEMGDEAKFCHECGYEIESSMGESPPAEGEATDVLEDENEGVDVGRLIVSGVMGIIVGAVVAFAFTNFGGGPFWFLITLIGVGYFLYSKQETPRLAAGMGFYITALWMPLAPIIFYLGLLGNTNTDTAAGAGAAIGSVVGMFLYGFIGLILGLVLGVIGYFLRKGERDE